jgi:hypothetical protein
LYSASLYCLTRLWLLISWSLVDRLSCLVPPVRLCIEDSRPPLKDGRSIRRADSQYAQHNVTVCMCAHSVFAYGQKRTPHTDTAARTTAHQLSYAPQPTPLRTCALALRCLSLSSDRLLDEPTVRRSPPSQILNPGLSALVLLRLISTSAFRLASQLLTSVSPRLGSIARGDRLGVVRDAPRDQRRLLSRAFICAASPSSVQPLKPSNCCLSRSPKVPSRTSRWSCRKRVTEGVPAHLALTLCPLERLASLHSRISAAIRVMPK